MSQDENDMSPEDRCRWLRERGVFIETAEERRMKQIRDIMNEKDDDGEQENLYFVHIPQDESLPFKELSVYTNPDRAGDILIDHLKPFFRTLSDKVDVSLLKDQNEQYFGNNAMPSTLSDEAIARVADEGQVEVFCLVRPVPSNKFTSINIYLDEIGMLKRLPLNRRAGNLAKQAGFDPEPLFYGDVFVGRLSTKPFNRNVSFRLGTDSGPSAKWLQTAVIENLEYQQALNQSSGAEGRLQPPVVASDGTEKEETGFSWTQTVDDVELIVPLTDSSLSSRDLKVKFNARKVTVLAKGIQIFSLELYANIDPEGCTWTMEAGKLVVSCEKGAAIMWPRVQE